MCLRLMWPSLRVSGGLADPQDDESIFFAMGSWDVAVGVGSPLSTPSHAAQPARRGAARPTHLLQPASVGPHPEPGPAPLSYTHLPLLTLIHLYLSLVL